MLIECLQSVMINQVLQSTVASTTGKAAFVLVLLAPMYSQYALDRLLVSSFIAALAVLDAAAHGIGLCSNDEFSC